MESPATDRKEPLLHAGQEAEEIRIPESSTRGWSWEILAMIASFGCTASIVAILAFMDDRPLADWHFFLSISATIAIFGTALKSTAAFAVGGCVSQYKWLYFKSSPRKLVDLDLIDEASRGPLGSLVLLARRPMGLASIAAAVTLLALAVETFVQQTVTFTPRNVAVDDGNAVLGLAHTYNGGAKPIRSSMGVINLSPSTADLSMQGAVYRGLFHLDSPAVFNCTSSCRWNSTYISLGFASTCTDVTDATLNLPPGAKPAELDRDRNLTTPGGVKLDASYSPTSWQTVISVRGISLLKPNSTWLSEDEMITYMPPEIARIGVLRADLLTPSWVIRTDTLEIVECDIRLAAYAYSNLSSTGNNLTEKRHPITLNRGVVTFVDNDTYADKLVFDQPPLPVLRASVPDIVALGALFTSSRFGGNIFDGETAPTQNTSGMGDAFRSGSIAKTFQNMVDSMTNQLRASFDVKAQGQSIKQVVFVQVRWPWLALPLVVQILSLVFLIFVLVQSSQTKTLPLWKSSTTAVLTYDIRGDESGMGKLGTGVLSKKELKALVKSVEVKLELPEQMMAAATGTISSDEDRKADLKGSQSHVYSMPKAGV
ncbi:hypothetical protein L209DRAFT_767441 [Thermothelomyces heterothallicus CBS 203.75]